MDARERPQALAPPLSQCATISSEVAAMPGPVRTSASRALRYGLPTIGRLSLRRV